MGWWLVLLLALAAPFARERLRPEIDARARRDAPGEIAPLPQGGTHYRWLGASRGPVAVCVHGLTTPSFVWEGLAPRLGALGFRVLVYDLYGRGFSDRAEGRQNAAFFVRQLEALLADQDVETSEVTLLGYSMGGAICTAFAAEHPEIDRLILIAPAGVRENLGWQARLVRDLPILGDWAFHLFFPRQLRQGIEAERALPASVPDIHDRQLAELRRRGFLPSVISSIRGILARSMAAEHRRIAETGLPVLALWGESDTLVPKASLGQLAQWNRGTVQEVIEGAGHGLPYTHTDEVARQIARFVEERPN
ncbi:alpha/beta hydrolase [Rhodosalinus halophilus]|uniref:Alpha/beta hydrolase n=1 Tax=Rhodosalinus halophilus TaxID=2259333 RepID=A0A365UAV2_9RHOB|nr:alpha/beta hydrolase [Rhodosalinus halophilus]RBI85871.1 alpha/beta hydrolase [Rhodosalinus halophilus]